MRVPERRRDRAQRRNQSLTNCGGTVYTTSASAADGSFSLSLNGIPAGQPVCLLESLPAAFNAVSVNGGTTAGTYTASTTTLRFMPLAGTNYSGIVLGDAPQSTCSVLYLDTNCNGTLEAPDSVITGPINVIAGQQVCILDKVNSPAGGSEGAKAVTTVSASEIWTVPTLTPGSQNHVLRNTDTTMVSVAGLTLLKDFRALSACPADAVASLGIATAHSSSGSAKPGDFLEYRVRYTNNTSAPLTNIKVHDSVPV